MEIILNFAKNCVSYFRIFSFKKKIIASGAVGVLLVFLLALGAFSFPKTSSANSGDSLSVTVTSVASTTAVLTAVQNRSFSYDVMTCIETASGTVDGTTCLTGHSNTDLTYARTSTTTSTWSFTNLLPNTTYYYFFADPLGSRISGASGATFTTTGSSSAGSGPSLSAHSEVSNSDGSQETITGTISNPSGATSVNISATASYPVVSSATVTATLDSSGNFSATLTGLTALTAYNYSVYAGSINTYPLTLSFTTGGVDPTYSITSKTSTSGGTQEVIVGNIANKGAATTVKITLGGESSIGTGPLDSSGNFSVTISGLAPSTNHAAFVHVSGELISPVFGFFTNVSGGGSGAGSVSSLSASSTSPTSEVISGTISSLASSTSFLITAQDMSAGSFSVTVPVSVHTGPTFSGTLTGLAPSTSYTCTITSLPDNTVIADSSVCPNFVTSASGTGGGGTATMTITNVTVTGRTVTITGTARDTEDIIYGKSSTDLTFGSMPAIIHTGSTSFTASDSFPSDSFYDGTYYFCGAGLVSGDCLTPIQNFTIASSTTPSTTGGGPTLSGGFVDASSDASGTSETITGTILSPGPSLNITVTVQPYSSGGSGGEIPLQANVNPTNGSFSMTFDGTLTPDTKYKYQITNSVDDSIIAAYDDTKTFTTNNSDGTPGSSGDGTGGTSGDPGSGSDSNTIVATSSILVFIGKIDRRIVNPLIIFAFACALAFFMYGVVKFIVDSATASEKNDGKQHMLWGIIGMFIMFAVFGILKLIEHTLGVDVSNNPLLYR